MLNIHLYRSNFLNESRINREVKVIEQMKIFNQIDLIGINQIGLLPKEKVSDVVCIYRFIGRNKKRNLFYTIFNIFLWHILVFNKYLFKDIKCINCHSINVFPLAVILKLIKGSKLIYDAHELETETAALSGFSKMIAKITERLLIRFSDHSIFVSESIENWYRRNYAIKNTTCIYNCPVFVKLKKTNYLNEKFNIDLESKIFIYQGAFVEDRGLEILLEVFKDGKSENNIVFLGFGKLEKKIKEFSKKYKNIFFHEKVKPDQVLKITKSANFGISLVDGKYLNHQFCLPNKLFEYIMAGLPVLVSDTIELKNFVSTNSVGIACKFEKKSLSQSIDEIILKENSFKKSLGKVSSYYDFNSQKYKYEKIYNKFFI